MHHEHANGAALGDLTDFAEHRHTSMRQLRTLVRQAKRHGVRDESVLAALASVPRDRFVPAHLASAAFDDAPLPIGEGQTISQPAMVAMMAEAARLNSGDRVLEVGTGSGYGAMVLAMLASRVISIERRPRLAHQAREALAQFPQRNIAVVVGDGTLGWPAEAPYDAIVVTAAGPVAPPPLLEQLAPAGRLIMPVGAVGEVQQLMRYTRLAVNDELPDRYRRTEGRRAAPSDSAIGSHRDPLAEDFQGETLTEVRFVPLVGDHGHAQ